MSVDSEPTELTNRSVVKATVIVPELAKHPKGATVSALATATGLPAPTAFRLLNSLERTGFVDRVDNRCHLGWELARLGRYLVRGTRSPFVETPVKRWGDDDFITDGHGGSGVWSDRRHGSSTVGAENSSERLTGSLFECHGRPFG